MMLAITGQWVGEVTAVLCLFGVACIGLAITATGGSGDRAAARTAEQKEQKPTVRPDDLGNTD